MRPILPILGVLSAIWLFGGAYWLSNVICGASGAATPAFSVSDGDFKTSSDNLFSFPHSSDKVSYTTDTKNSFRTIGQYLTEHPTRQLSLTGEFASKEKNNSSFENLGLARAESIKDLMISLGASADHITTSSQQVDNLSFLDKKLYGGVNFLFEEKTMKESLNGKMETTNGDALSDIGSGSGVGALTLMFEESQVDYEPTADLNEHIAYLKTYLSATPGATVYVTGHTDNQGNREDKMKIAESRAKKVRRILRNAGLGSDQVKWRAVGPNEPVASNESSDGIAKNNRVVISVEK